MGIILAKIAEEELELGEKYFVFLKELILFLGIIFWIDMLGLNIIYFIVISVIVYLIIKNYDLPTRWGYLFLIIIFFMSINNKNLLLIESILMFIYGLVTAGLWARYLPLSEKQEIIAHRGASLYEAENT